MIKANELRIGNFVFVIGVAPVIITADHIKSVSEGDQDYSPIPLTPEILEKCGFDGKNHPKRRFKRLDGIFTLYFEDGILTMEDEDWCENRMPHIKCLHQLQNLYHALTGQELEIKL